jgi:RNA polymerase sigma-70 factor (ECF subfamily)
MEIERYIVATDQQLISMSLEGDAVAFEQLFTRYRESIFQLYLQRTGSRDDADDLLQETFVKIFLKLDSYNPSFTFGQWAYTIARNTFIDYTRKRRDDLSVDSIPGGYSSIAPTAAAPTPEESIINSQQRAQIEQHMAKMEPRYRRLIELRFFRDYSYEEIARELALPLGTVKTRIHRAREQLCRLIADNSDIMS